MPSSSKQSVSFHKSWLCSMWHHPHPEHTIHNASEQARALRWDQSLSGMFYQKLFLFPYLSVVKTIKLTEYCVIIPSIVKYIRHFSSLSEADKSFLDSRQICCNGVCKCANGDQPVSCFRPPCSPPEEPPCEEAVKCVDNYCGGCVAEWFQEDKLPACKERNNIIFG